MNQTAQRRTLAAVLLFACASVTSQAAPVSGEQSAEAFSTPVSLSEIRPQPHELGYCELFNDLAKQRTFLVFQRPGITAPCTPGQQLSVRWHSEQLADLVEQNYCDSGKAVVRTAAPPGVGQGSLVCTFAGRDLYPDDNKLVWGLQILEKATPRLYGYPSLPDVIKPERKLSAQEEYDITYPPKRGGWTLRAN